MLLRCLVLGVVIAVVSGLIGGCGIFSPEKSGDPGPAPPIVYPTLDQPSRVLLALEIAYAERDSVNYLNLFDYDYLGTSTSPETTVTFRNSDERDHIQALARVTTIIGKVYFDLGPETSWTRLPSDDLGHPEWANIQISGANFTIRIDDGPTTYEVHGNDELFTFTFKPTLTSTPGDTLWNIIRWQETKS